MLICFDQRTNDGCGAENRNDAAFCASCGRALRFALQLHDRNAVVGDYRIGELIGHGGYGAVYTAEHRQRPGTTLALKATFDPASIGSLQNEFAALQDLHHPNLPRYHAWFEHQGQGYLVMELVAGQNLEVLLVRRGGPLSATLVLDYALQLCDVLSYLHAQPRPILHRDIKPANIRLTHAEQIKLVDFGLLKQGTQATRKTVRGFGTLAYAPVEQFGGEGRRTDARSDLYSLGATLYHLLTGREPPPVTERMAAEHDPLQPPHHVYPAISPYVAEVVLRAMSVPQHQRYPDVASFKAALLQAGAQPFQVGPSVTVPGATIGTPTVALRTPTPNPGALRRLWQQARTAEELGQWEQAEALLAQVVALDPAYQDVQTRLAKVRGLTEQERRYTAIAALRANDDWEEVLDTWATFPPNYPDPQGHRPWAEVRQRRDQRYEAALDAAAAGAWPVMLDHLTALLAEVPDDADATALLARAQAQQAEAARQRKEATRRQREAAERLEREEAERLKREAAGTSLTRGNTAYNLKHLEQALADYTQAIALDPKYALAYNNRGLTHRVLKHLEQALADYTQAILLDPKFANAYNNRGNTYRDLKHLEEALADYTQAIVLDPKFAIAYNNRGSTYYDLKHLEQALADYTQAITLDPKFALAYNGRGNTYRALKHLEQALADYTQAITLDPKDANAYNNRGLLHQERNERDAAIADFRRAYELYTNPTDQQKAINQLKALGAA